MYTITSPVNSLSQQNSALPMACDKLTCIPWKSWLTSSGLLLCFTLPRALLHHPHAHTKTLIPVKHTINTSYWYAWKASHMSTSADGCDFCFRWPHAFWWYLFCWNEVWRWVSTRRSSLTLLNRVNYQRLHSQTCKSIKGLPLWDHQRKDLLACLFTVARHFICCWSSSSWAS